MSQQQQQPGEAPPGNGRYMPGETQRPSGELGAAEQLWQIGPTKQANENVPLTQPGMRQTDGKTQKCCNVESGFHMQSAIALNSELGEAKDTHLLAASAPLLPGCEPPRPIPAANAAFQ